MSDCQRALGGRGLLGLRGDCALMGDWATMEAAACTRSFAFGIGVAGSSTTLFDEALAMSADDEVMRLGFVVISMSARLSLLMLSLCTLAGVFLRGYVSDDARKITEGETEEIYH